MPSFKIPTLPTDLHWKNSPVSWAVEGADGLQIEAGPISDWFIDPAGAAVKDDAPVALFAPGAGEFTLQARVTVDFAATFDAGVLMLYSQADLWAKLCFEFSPQGQPMIVSVVTRGVSDDCNSTIISGNQVYVRLARLKQAIAFHYSTDGAYWHLVRYFSLGGADPLWAGFSAQSPTGPGCRVHFAEIAYRPVPLTDLRSGL